MKIHPQLQSKFTNFCREYSSEIEYDSIIRYVNSVSLFLDEKIEEFKTTKDVKSIIKQYINEALVVCDKKGITSMQQRIALEILNKYWIHGSNLKDIKIAV